MQKTMRMDALVVFRSILKRQSSRFRDYAELTILKICEAHKDPAKDVRTLHTPGSLVRSRPGHGCSLMIMGISNGNLSG